MAKLSVQTFKSINEIDSQVWDRIVAGERFSEPPLVPVWRTRHGRMRAYVPDRIEW